MQYYGGSGGAGYPSRDSPPPPPPYYPPPQQYPYMGPRRNVGGLIIIIVGLIILIIGIIIAVFFVTYDEYADYDSPKEVIEKILKGEYEEGDTVKMIGEVVETGEEGGEKVMYLKDFEIDPGMGELYQIPLKNDIGAKKGDTVAVKLGVGDQDIDAEIVSEYGNIYGIVGGVIVLIIGVILLIFGVIRSKRDRPVYRRPPPPRPDWSSQPQQPSQPRYPPQPPPPPQYPGY